MRILAEICMLLAIGVLAYVAAIKNVDRGPGYDDELRSLVAMVQPGDWEGADKASSYCSAVLKPYGDNESSAFLGRCAGPEFLTLITIIESGDPVKIKEEFERRNEFDFDFKRHLPYMKQFARSMIQQRCQSSNPPTTCLDAATIKWFDQ